MTSPRDIIGPESTTSSPARDDSHSSSTVVGQSEKSGNENETQRAIFLSILYWELGLTRAGTKGEMKRDGGIIKKNLNEDEIENRERIGC